MNIEDEIFKKSKIDYDKLIKYGFINNDKIYYYSEKINNDSFRVDVYIKNDNIKIKVIDLLTSDEYITYRINEQNGVFVDSIRKQIRDILTNIRDNCCTNNMFIFDQTNRIIEFIKKTFNDNPLFLFDNYSDCCVFKNQSNNKWYGIIMSIDKSKIVKNKNGLVEIINLKIKPDEIKELLDKSGYYEAYHMNKKYWISLILDDTISDKEIEKLIIESHNNIIKK